MNVWKIDFALAEEAELGTARTFPADWSSAFQAAHPSGFSCDIVFQPYRSGNYVPYQPYQRDKYRSYQRGNYGTY